MFAYQTPKKDDYFLTRPPIYIKSKLYNGKQPNPQIPTSGTAQ